MIMPTESGDAALLPIKRCGDSGDRYLWFLVSVASLGGFLFGYDTGVVSGAMIKIVPAFDLDDFQHEMVVSSTIAMAAVGAACSGPANSMLGRKRVLIVSCVIFTAGAVLMAAASSYVVLLWGRVVVGLAVGIASSTVPQYIAELAPPARRGLLVSVNNAAVVVGQVSASLVDGALSRVSGGWRLMLGLGGVPSTIMLCGLFMLPESPRWLIVKGRFESAKQVLYRLREGQTDIESAVESEFGEILDTLAAEGVMPVVTNSTSAVQADAAEGDVQPAAQRSLLQEAQETMRDLWGVRRQLQLGLGLMVLQQVIGINTIMYYSGDILKQARVGNDETVIWLTAPVACGQLAGCLIGMQLIDKHGRRPLVLGSLVGVVASLAFEGAVFATDRWYCNIDLDAGSGADASDERHDGICAVTGWLSLIAMIAYLLAFGGGMSAIPWTINSEIYPMRSRSLCMGLATATNWIANLVVAATFLSLEAAVTRPVTFWLYGFLATLGFGLLALYMPETAKKKLEEIENMFTSEPRSSGEASASA